MIVEILTLGDELLDGRRVDTNSAWLGRAFTAAGAPPRFGQTVSDRVDEIARAFRYALSRSDFIVATGGLGPTADDVTFEALALALGRPLRFHPELYEAIEKRFRQRGLRCPESNRRQATLPEGSEPVSNEWGTAPGLRIEESSRVIFCLPGVPKEMEMLFDKAIKPEILRRMGREGRVEKTYRFFGLPESHVEERIDRCGFSKLEGGEIRVAYTATFPEIHVTLSVFAEESGKAESLARKAESAIERELGEQWIGTGEESLQGRTVRLLSERGLRLSLAESITGGAIASLLVGVPGCSAVLDRGVVVYSDESKTDLLGVSPATLKAAGAVSEACAEEMARGALERSGADVAVAVTGIAGPEGGTAEKPLGLTYIAWVGPFGAEVKRYQFRWDRNRNRMLAVYEALAHLNRLVARVNKP